ncbi:biliverdin-producing heme oxygenase [Methylobacter sp. S3L5C]|uniref:biliverdin-producing heme oxygenase n=1 Tax=Methylobacter sp. S3L5C TaxID=2839024 RepID=UPI001FAE46E1|nr:biliverdin-producing heme oxygenase [Methylobacter sp. S3L5C]UOA10175.1 biliverdin-producing heme oxygenase [Methylobacter sp. S3L5C]
MTSSFKSSQDKNKGLTLRTLLRDATHHHHLQLNRHLLLAGLTQPNYPLSHYQTLLCTYYQLYALLEGRINLFLKGHLVAFNYSERSKLSWLIKDLDFFQIDILALHTLSQTATDFLKIETIGQLVGVLYVVEGSTLGGQMISQVLAKNYSFRHDAGSCFFIGYGEKTMTFWQQFIAFSDTLSGDKHECQAAVEAAGQTFQLFNQVLDDVVHQNYMTVS